MKRSDLPDNVFGIPEERKYPMPDKKHTLSAIKLFGHVEDKYEKELAKNIIKNMKKFNISDDVVGDNNRLKKYLKEGYENTDNAFIVDEWLTVEEASKVNRKRLYHLSQSNLDKKTIQPSVPSNYLTKNGYEDATTPRVCFSTSIDGCLRGLSQNLTGKEFFVHIPDGDYEVFAPSKKEVPDSKVTHEVWIKESVKLKCIGKIKVIDDKGEDGLPYTYGDGNKAELYDWNWQWLEKINESFDIDDNECIEEGTFNQLIMQLPIQKYNIQHKTPINNVADLVKYHKNPGLDNYVTKCKDTDDLAYLRRDTRTVIPTLNTIRDRITDCRKGETNKNKGYYKNIKKKYLDNDLSEKDVDLTLTWVKDVCNRITNKIKQLEKGITTEAVAGLGTVVGTNTCEPIYIVNYMQNNVFSGSHQERFGICKSGMKDLHTVGGKYNKLHYTNLDEFEEEAEDIKVYKYNGNINKSFHSIIEDAENDLDFYTMLTGQSITNRSDIEKNGDFARESYIRDELSAIQECVTNTIVYCENSFEIPLLGINEYGRSYNYYRDLDGVYAKNELTGLRCKSYDSVEDISESVLNLVKNGFY